MVCWWSTGLGVSSALGIAFGTQNHLGWKKHFVGSLCPEGRMHHLSLTLLEWFNSQRGRGAAFPALLPLCHLQIWSRAVTPSQELRAVHVSGPETR